MRARQRAAILGIIILTVAATGCRAVRRDRCYLAETRYISMKALFESTGSYQRAAQAMEDAQWSHCEKNTFRLRLREDLDMNEPEFDQLFQEVEPSRKELDFNPGRVEKVVK